VGAASAYSIGGIVARKLIIYICIGRLVVEEDEPHLYDEEDSVLKEISESISKNRRSILNGSNVNPGTVHSQPIVSMYS